MDHPDHPIRVSRVGAVAALAVAAALGWSAARAVDGAALRLNAVEERLDRLEERRPDERESRHGPPWAEPWAHPHCFHGARYYWVPLGSPPSFATRAISAPAYSR